MCRTSPWLRPRARGGFSVLELLIVLTIGAVILGFAGLYMTGYLRRVSASRSAQVFAQDLRLARSTALRTRSPVVIRFDESSMWYALSIQETGLELARRRFGSDGSIDLGALDLRMPGDSLVFNSRGVANLTGTLNASGLGEARFTLGTELFYVYFNAMGSATVAES